MSREGLVGSMVNQRAPVPLKGGCLSASAGYHHIVKEALLPEFLDSLKQARNLDFHVKSQVLEFLANYMKKKLSYIPNKIYFYAEFNDQFELLAQRAQV